MSNTVSDRDHLIDLESGGTTSEEDGPKFMVSGCGQTKKILCRVWSGFTTSDESSHERDEDITSSCNNSNHTSQTSFQSSKLVAEEQKSCFADKNGSKEKPKKKSHKKAAKPPRPPKPPSLDAADHKLIKEISELAMLKRARIERMKALRKARAAKSTSTGNSVCAMVITIIFCLVIILQGVFSRGSSILNSHGTPESAMGSQGGGLILIQHHRNTSGSEAHDPGSQSPNVVEQVTGSEKNEHKVVL